MYKVDMEQKSIEWLKARHGNVTGTSLASALGTPAVQKTLMYSLIADRMTEVQMNDLSTPAIDRGNELEPFAIRATEEETGIQFAETGLLLNDTYPRFSISPDGIVEDENGIIIGGIETKCPNSKKHVEYLIKDEIPKEYLHQVKAPFVMSDDVKFWVFASFDDRNYERPLFVKTVTRDDFNDIDECRAKLLKFLDVVNDGHMDLTF
jgi:putative phage-type endonuclease